ncbi:MULTISPECIES: hypothetical protein [Kaistia]|uniref:DUF1344 domain-containing protein n=1 Tax=Kaistia nematophila TaxID=2994654 RepID=A0A9X3DYC9_9HYPH|nr:hypothetical protein [Kaistia nematophila]MCX5567721.1 hypothetical protein [Kaistia nematophila]
MKKHLYLLPLAGLLLASGTALAAETMNGVVARADPYTGELVLLGGANIQVSDPSVLRHLAPGEHVIITRNDNDTIGVQVDSSYSGSGSSN